MLRWSLALAGIAALSYLGLCAAVFLLQRSLLDFPQPRSATEGASTLTLPVDAARILVTVRPHEGPNALLYFGGNAEDVTQSLPGLVAAFPTHALYLLHYRGYGGSSGRPSEAALVGDALALFDQVRSEHPSVVAVGRSLGSGVAIQLAGQRPVARLVLVTPYESILEIAQGRFPFLPVRWLLLDKFESWRHATRVTAQTLLIVAANDAVIPRKSSEALHGRFPAGRASLRVIADVGHDDISLSPDYLRLLQGLP
jgi:pimeloyl-ACP methyl ester carboxylesterase